MCRGWRDRGHRGCVPGDRGETGVTGAKNRGHRGENHTGTAETGAVTGAMCRVTGVKSRGHRGKNHTGAVKMPGFSRKSRVTGAKKPGLGRCTGAKKPQKPGFRLLSGRILPGSGAGRDGFASSLARTCARTRRAFRTYKEACLFWAVFLKFLTKNLKKGVDFPGLQSDVCHRAEAHSPARPRVGKATGSGRSP